MPGQGVGETAHASDNPRVHTAIQEKCWIDERVNDVFHAWAEIFGIRVRGDIVRYTVFDGTIHIVEQYRSGIEAIDAVHKVPEVYLLFDEPLRTTAMKSNKAEQERIKAEAERREKIKELAAAESTAARLRRELGLEDRPQSFKPLVLQRLDINETIKT